MYVGLYNVGTYIMDVLHKECKIVTLLKKKYVTRVEGDYVNCFLCYSSMLFQMHMIELYSLKRWEDDHEYV
jgi:hypothetical protein